MDPSRGDSRYNLNYSMSSIGLSLADHADLYGNPAAPSALGSRSPSGGLIHTLGGACAIGLGGRSSGILMSNSTHCQSLSNTTSSSSGGPGQQQSRGLKRTNSGCYDEHLRGGNSGAQVGVQLQGLERCTSGAAGQQQQSGGNVPDVLDDSYNSMQNKKSPPANGKKTKGRVKIKMEYIDNKLRRYTTFSKRKTGIMKKAYELSTLTGTQVMLLVASETGHVYTFATRKLQPMITSEAGKQLIQTCLNSPDPPGLGSGDQRMSATGFEETELSYNIADEDSKDDRSSLSSPNESDESSEPEPSFPEKAHYNTSKDFESSVIPTLPSSPVCNGYPHQSNTNNLSVDFSARLQNQCEPGIALGVLTTSVSSALAAVSSTSSASCTTGLNSPTSSGCLSRMPQEVLAQIIQSGHLELHTEDGGSNHQYITIPISLSSSTPSSSSRYRTIGNNIRPINVLFNEEENSRQRVKGGSGTTLKSITSYLLSDSIKQELLD